MLFALRERERESRFGGGSFCVDREFWDDMCYVLVVHTEVLLEQKLQGARYLLDQSLTSTSLTSEKEFSTSPCKFVTR